MTLEEFKMNIPGFIKQAISVGNKVLEGKVNLSCSLSGIKEMDPVIAYFHNLWVKGLIDDNVAWNSSVSFGVLLGEIIIREHDFHWEMRDDLPVIETDDHNQLSPISKLYKIITAENDVEGSPSGFYNGFIALQQYYAMSDEERKKNTHYIDL